MSSSWTLFRCLLPLTAWLGISDQPAQAFYEKTGKEGALDLRGSIQALGSFSKNPGDEVFFPEDMEFSGGGILRLLVLADYRDRVSLDFNGFQFYAKTVAPGAGSEAVLPGGAERSSAFEWNQSDDPDVQARLGIDRLSLRFLTDRADFILGRQPINLATVFYFTPNDFFAPFSPNAFFRLYKPGVDAARLEARLGALSQFSLISVFGYEPDLSSPDGWSREPEVARSSLLGRFSATGLGFEWGVLGGSVRGESLAGGSLQGELGGWLGIRAEGHYAWGGANLSEETGKIALDLEHRFENGLTVRLEQFYHSQGYRSNDELNRLIVGPRLPGLFLARHYTALGWDYEFGPLLSAQMLSVINWIDPSFLFSLNAIYSLADEADLVLGITVPAGKRSSSPRLESEFGALPATAFLEARYFF